MTRRNLAGRFLVITVLLSLATMAAAQMPTTTTETEKGAGTVTTRQLNGEVIYVEGNTLVVELANKELWSFDVPESRRFIIDGKELTVHELQSGTQLTATVSTTSTPVTVRTKTIGSGKVWYVMGKNVILTLPNGENRQYFVQDDTQFVVEGKPATVSELRKGMVVSAERIVEQPAMDITTDVKVVGKAPVQRAPQAAAAPAVAQAPPPATVAQAQPTLPKTASRVPLAGALGALLVGASLAIWLLRRL